ncbi:hypothetical protein HK099_002615 [Clydaea vesicula]|uniref:Nuclear segregation protein BFR1 n=1 Tax=Clydaea vesicula TaxID=447962 RepID=A0AAD5TSX2_9FUNG|nr:hypothetical protein HK099_002615 [Clydaea vesicula]KAJ3381350.1 hypothetical protein HDU92_005446 [Lobulomyces angularis]
MSVDQKENKVDKKTDTKNQKYTSKRIPKPDEEAYKIATAECEKNINLLKEKLVAAQAKVTGGSSGNSKNEYEAKRAELKASFDKLFNEKKALENERSKVFDQIKKIKADIKKRGEEVKSSKDKLGVKSVKDVDVQVATLEAQLAGGKLNLSDEKKIVQEISSLKKARKVLDGFSAQESTFENDKKNLDELHAKLKVFDEKRKELNSLIDASRSEKNEFESNLKEKIGSLSSLYEARDEAKKNLDAEYTKVKKLRSDFKVAKDEFYQHLKAERERKNEAYQIEKQQIRDRKLTEEAEREREEAEIPAYTEEINQCETLIKHFNQYIAGSNDANGQTQAAAVNANIRKVDDSLPEGAAVLVKNKDREEDFMVMGGKKNKKNRKHEQIKENNTPVTKVLKLDLLLIDQLAKLKIEIPSSIKDVESTLKSLEEKKKFFKENQASKTLENKKKAEEKISLLKERANNETDVVETEA